MTSQAAPLAIQGQQGWLFFTPDGPQGVQLTNLNRVAGLWREAAQLLEARGTRTIFALLPAKFRIYRDTVLGMSGRPVTIRTLDLGADKADRTGLVVGREENPALGLRGIRLALARPAVADTQLRAILRASGYGPLRILLPMISGREEIRAARALIDEVAAELRTLGCPGALVVDVDREGTRKGPEVELLVEFAEALQAPVVAANISAGADFRGASTAQQCIGRTAKTCSREGGRDGQRHHSPLCRCQRSNFLVAAIGIGCQRQRQASNHAAKGGQITTVNHERSGSEAAHAGIVPARCGANANAASKRGVWVRCGDAVAVT